MLGNSPGQYAAMNFGMQGLDPAIQNFRKTGNISYFYNLNASLSQGFIGTSGGDDFITQSLQTSGKINYTCFVGNTNQSSFHFATSLKFRPMIDEHLPALYVYSAFRNPLQYLGINLMLLHQNPFGQVILCIMMVKRHHYLINNCTRIHPFIDKMDRTATVFHTVIHRLPLRM